MFRYNFLFAALFFSYLLPAQTTKDAGYNCYSILVGKEAAADGSVLLAHNEDDWGERVVNLYKVPAQTHQKGDSVTLHRGGKLAQTPQTYAYLWLEMPGLEFSDSYINEYGVTVTSDACPSKEDQAEITDGGIGYQLRRLMAERARSAREAVKTGGELIDKFGYVSSGRTYCIADDKEAWMLSVVKGKHWIARRIPDNQVAIIPNYYTIDYINLKDTLNFMGSPDIIDYAVKRGWYKPEIDGRFNFRQAYGNKRDLKQSVNTARHWVILNQLSEKQYQIDEDFPFSFVPKQKIDLALVFKLLRNHYEGTEFYIKKSKMPDPHFQQTMTVCSLTNQYGFVAQLRSNLPKEIAHVLWWAPRRPCTSAFVPLYPAMDQVDRRWQYNTWQEALKNHFKITEDFKTAFPKHHYHILNHFTKIYYTEYFIQGLKRRQKMKELENKLLKNQSRFEAGMMKKLKKNPDKVPKLLRKYSFKYVKKNFIFPKN